MNVVAIVLIAGGSEGYMYRFGLVRNWARPVLFIGGILVGLPEWKSTVVGLGLAIVIFAFPKFSRAEKPAASFESIPEIGENVA